MKTFIGSEWIDNGMFFSSGLGIFQVLSLISDYFAESVENLQTLSQEEKRDRQDISWNYSLNSLYQYVVIDYEC